MTDQQLMDYAVRQQRISIKVGTTAVVADAAVAPVVFIAAGAVAAAVLAVAGVVVAAAFAAFAAVTVVVAAVATAFVDSAEDNRQQAQEALNQKGIQVERTLNEAPWLTFQNNQGIAAAPPAPAPAAAPAPRALKDNFISAYTTRELPFKRPKFNKPPAAPTAKP